MHARLEAAVPKVQKLLRRFGVQLHRWPPVDTAADRIVRLARDGEVTVVLDVGANDGGYATRLRDAGYAGRLVSFEPLLEPYRRLERLAAADPLWETRHMALGDSDGTATMHVAANSVSSSLLAMEPLHSRSAPESAYVDTEAVPTGRLDDLAPELLRPDDRVYLKIDVQGYEMRVLRGAADVLAGARYVELELSLAPLYEAGPLMPEVVAHMDSAGFHMIDVVPGLFEPKTGDLLQVDGVFARSAR